VHAANQRWRATVSAVGLAVALAACGSAPPGATPSASRVTSTTTTTPTTPTSRSVTTSPPTTSTAATSTPGGSTSSRTSHPTSSTSAPTTSTLPGPLRGKVVTRIPTTRKVVALTFDAGASPDGVSSILRTLAAQAVPASFFLTGDFARQQPVAAQRMAGYGRVGNHTSDHPHLTTLGTSDVRAQLTSARSTIMRTTSEDPLPFFRFPFGEYDARTLGAVKDLGYVAVGWTVDTLGWKGTSGGQSADTVVDRVLSAATPGQIVLMHVGANPDDGTTLDADALPRVIAGLRAAGYDFVTLQALLG
jgi:peptidoglycan/xylan/chitin deacetylase (PgdA/CDA1 family)